MLLSYFHLGRHIMYNNVPNCSNSSMSPHYRLADVVSGTIAHREYHHSWGLMSREYNQKFPGSIAASYLDHANAPYMFDVLCKVVRMRGQHMQCNSGLPNASDAVVHVRAGDVTTGIDKNILWKKGSKPFQVGLLPPVLHVKPKAYFEDVVTLLPPGVQRIVIVTSSIHGGGGSRDAAWGYNRLLIRFFKAKGFSVSVRWKFSPDEDFVFMSHASIFVYGGGGFSRLVGECVKRLGGWTSAEPDSMTRKSEYVGRWLVFGADTLLEWTPIFFWPRSCGAAWLTFVVLSAAQCVCFCKRQGATRIYHSLAVLVIVLIVQVYSVAACVSLCA